MVELEFRKIISWMTIVILIAGIAVSKELQTNCPLYKIHFCACSVNEKAKATPLKMCFYKVPGGENCEPCTGHEQTYINCSKCPENNCPICSADDFGPQNSNDKTNNYGIKSHPEQVFFSFSTGLGNTIYVTPKSPHKVLPIVSHISSFKPKYVEKSLKLIGNHERSFMTLKNVDSDRLIEYFKNKPLKKQKHVNVNSIIFKNYSVPDNQFHPAQVIFSFSTGLGKTIYVTPKSTHKMLPIVSHTYSFKPKYGEKSSKLIGNHESGFMKLLNVDPDRFIKHFKYKPLKKQEHVNVNSINFKNYNVPDSESHPAHVVFSFSMGLGNTIYVTPKSIHKMLPIVSHTSFLKPKYVEKSSKLFGNRERKFKALQNVYFDRLMKYFRYRPLKKQEHDNVNSISFKNYNVPDGEPNILILGIVESDRQFNRDVAEDELSGMKHAVVIPDKGVSKRPQFHHSTSMNMYPPWAKIGTGLHYRKLKKTTAGKTQPIRPKNIGDKGKIHTNVTKNMDMVPVANILANKPDKIIITNSPGKIKYADISNASLFEYKGNLSLVSQIAEVDGAFDTTSGDSSYTEFDDVNNRYSRVKNSYPLSILFENLSTISTPPRDMAHVKNSEVLNIAENHDIDELARQDFSDNVTVLLTTVNGTTFHLVTSEKEIVKENGTGIMSSDIREGQQSESSLKSFSTDENPESVRLNLQNFEDFRRYMQQIFDATNSSVYATDHDLSSNETPEHSVGENQTADIIDEKVSGSHRIVSSHSGDQPGMSNSLATTRRINDNNESLNFGLPKETEISLPSLSAVKYTSDFAIDQHSFRDQSSDNTENKTNKKRSIDNLFIMSHFFDEYLRKTNVPKFPQGKNYNGDWGFREINDTLSPLRSTLFEQVSSGYVTPQHFLNNATSEKSETAKGTGTDATVNKNKMPPYLQEQQRKQSGLPTTLQEGDNENEVVNFSTTDDIGSNSSHPLDKQDTSHYRSDKHFDGSQASEYIVNHKGTIGTNMDSIGNLTTLSSDKHDEELGGLKLPTIPNHENFGNEEIHFRMRSDSTRQFRSHLLSTLFVQSSSGYVTPQHFLNDETTEGTGTDTLKNLKKSPYLQGQQRKQSGLPTLQEGENVNKDGNFSSTNDTGNHSSRTLARQDISHYRSDKHFDGSQTSKYIEDHKGTTGTNDMNGIDNLTTLSSDKPDQQLGGLNLPTIPNHENFGNEGIHFRMRSDSTIQFPISLLENAKNPNFHDDVTSEYKDEGKETTGTNDKIGILTVRSLSYTEEYPGQSNVTILEARQPMVTNDIVHTSKLVGLSSHPLKTQPDTIASSPLFENTEKFQTKRDSIYYTTPRTSAENKPETSAIKTRASSESPPSLPLFESNENVDIKRGNINHTSPGNRHKILPIQTRASPEKQSNYSSGLSRHSVMNYDFSTQKFRIGKKLLRFAEVDHNNPEATHFRITDFVRKPRLAKDFADNSWCSISGSALYGNLKCNIWTHKKECVLKCLENRRIDGRSEATFLCNRRKNVWEPKLQSCIGDSQESPAREPEPVERKNVQKPKNLRMDSKRKPKEAEELEEQRPIYEYIDDTDSQSSYDDYGEYEYITENYDGEVIQNDSYGF